MLISNFDFSSSFVLYASDDEDDEDNYANHHHHHHHHQLLVLDERKKLDDMKDAFIELDLRRPAAVLAPGEAITDHQNDDKELMEYFRISFSSIVPFPGFRPPSSIDISANNYNNIPQDANSQHIPNNILPLPPPAVDDDDCRPINDHNSWKLVQSCRNGKASSAKMNTSGTENSGIMKLVVKIRCIISGLQGLAGSMGASLIFQRPCRGSSSAAAAADTNTRGMCRNIAFMKKPFDKWITWPRNLQDGIRSTRIITSSSSSPSSSSTKVLEMNKLIDAKKNLLVNVMSPLKMRKTGSSRLNKSCPTSIKSSPLHQYQSGDDTSLVPAAIAHCKKSFRGETDDFSF